jgi:Protein of unknown function (DUF2914)/Tetratricopeptide repeat
MPEPREARSIIEAAEQSAAAGDHASAEKLLREAAVLQEASLGPLHPDLANTLNNLGVVCEMNDNPVDAEHCFRRAFAIATTVLEPDHPFVATSRQNLRDFCEARGKSFELLPSSPAPTTRLAEPATTAVDPLSESPSHPESQDVQVRRRFIRPLAIGGLGPAVMVIMILTAVRLWPSSTEHAQSPSAIATDSPREIPARPQAPLSAEPITLPKETTRTGEGDGGSARRITEASIPERPTLVRARLCADLEDFACDPPDRPVPPGPLFFYTEVKSTSATTIQHRWYRDNRLYQSVQLRVQASPRVAYRTFSRNTMTGDSAGSWRVELRTEDGVLLHEERFSVR